MSAKWQHRDEGKKVSKSVIRAKSTEELQNASKFIQGLLDLRKAEKLQKTYIHGTSKALDYNETDKLYVDYRLDGTQRKESYGSVFPHPTKGNHHKH